MSDTGFGWAPLLDSAAPEGCWLKAALFTTYDRADGRVLAEHLLPQLLKLGREPDGEGAERQYFLLELDRRLKQLHDKLVVVSSTAREEPADPDGTAGDAYGWIWRSIRPLTVGSRRRAVQHAKLWMLHWGAEEPDGAERLELVISSANLTRPAFRGQLQAAWRVCLELHDRPSDARRAAWGVLPAFLRELSASAGDPTHLDPFVKLLARADSPGGVTFVASVPGTHSQQVLRTTPWGAAGLRNIVPPGRVSVRVSVLSPFLGTWDAAGLRGWCEKLESAPDHLDLVWIDKNHPWARPGRWLAPKETLEALVGAGASLLRLRYEAGAYEGTDLFHEEHRPTDDRWSHAKVYGIRRGSSRRVLVTSANFSAAAWGRATRDGLVIENFELGVCAEGGTWPFGDLEEFEDVATTAASVTELPARGSVLIQWARAVWDGDEVAVECRCADDRDVAGTVCGGDVWVPVSDWTISGGPGRSARVPWADAKTPPAFVQLSCDEETVCVPIFDTRSAPERETATPPEVDGDVVQAMRDELLFEQYGGRVADDDPLTAPESEEPTGAGPEPGGDADPDSDAECEGGGRADSYAVPAFTLARRHLAVIDNWWARVTGIAKRGGQFERDILRRDGELLIEAFRRQAERDARKESARALGATLAVEELTVRLRHFPEA